MLILLVYANSDWYTHIDYLPNIFQMYPHSPLAHKWKVLCEDSAFTKISKGVFGIQKEKLLVAESILRNDPGLDEEGQKQLVAPVMEATAQNTSSGGRAWVTKILPSLFRSANTSSDSQKSFTEFKDLVATVSDEEFLARASDIASEFPILGDAAKAAVQSCQRHFSELIKKKGDEFAKLVQSTQREECRKQIKRKAEIYLDSEKEISRVAFLDAVRDTFVSNRDRYGHGCVLNCRPC